MTLHLIYKEWIKTRWFALVALVTGLAAVVGIFAGVAGVSVTTLRFTCLGC